MGRYINLPTITTGGQRKFQFSYTGSTCSWTVPSGVTCATFELWGGGGAGSPNCCCNCQQGYAGSGGGYTIKTIATVPGCVYIISVGCGGYAIPCFYNSSDCGCAGSTTYVTGYNLSNLCATGGSGGTGYSTSYTCTYNTYPACTGGIGYGGDVNLQGSSSSKLSMSGYCQTSVSGAAPFGGGIVTGTKPNYITAHYGCGSSGSFPGGGGSPRPAPNSWCDCCAGCGGPGASGFILITT